MSFTVNKITVKSTDNIHTLKGKIYIPDSTPKGILHIVHGMTEHIERYDSFMGKVCENGYIVFGFDNLGHGKTANSDLELGFIAPKDGYEYLINDVAEFSREVARLYPELPVYLFGHSMGSFIARLTAAKYPTLYKKLIICGTAGKNPLAKMGILLAKTIKKVKGEKYISDFIINMAFGSYNKKFDGDPKYSWLTKDEAIIEKYRNDKFCTFKFTVSAMADLITLIMLCNENSWYKKIAREMPILLISGELDPVGNYSKGVKEVYSKLLKENANVKIKLFKNCRHEILNDTCKDEATAEILRFIK